MGYNVQCQFYGTLTRFLKKQLNILSLSSYNISQKWTMPIRDWKGALNRFAIEFEGRMPD
jgi:transposase-like protein